MGQQRSFDGPGFIQDLRALAIDANLNDIDALLGIAIENGRFSPEFIENAARRAMKAILRNELAAGIVDPDTGEKIKSINVEELDPETGETRKGYKQLQFLTIDDFEYAIRDVKRRIKSESRKLTMLCRLAYARFGDEIQGRFEFKLPLGKKASV